MARVKIIRTRQDGKSLGIEIACLADLDTKELRARWHSQTGRRAPCHLPRHLLFRLLAYGLQAKALGDLDGEYKRVLDTSASSEAARKKQASGLASTIQKGTILTREWKGRVHRVAVLANGFAWNGDTYSSLSRVACAITGTRWNGPRFFGLRDQLKTQSESER